MHSVIVAGSGNIGSTIAYLLAYQDDYQVHLIDQHPTTKPPAHPRIAHHQLDISDSAQVKQFFQQHQGLQAIVACVPYSQTLAVAKIALENHLHYFDLTEDVQTGKQIEQLAQRATTAFVPHCGLAPGLVGMLAYDLMQKFENVDTVKLRCGALPEHTSNALQYALTWSTDGLINEYGNPCPIIDEGKLTVIPPLTHLEEVQIDGLAYEAFNTSGGLGNLINACLGKVNTLNYKTIRYQGHCEKMRFLMQDLKLNQNRAVLKKILEDALPITKQDVVLLYVAVHGYQDNHLIKKDYVNKFYPKVVGDKEFSAIQMSTASSACTVLDMVLANSSAFQGIVEHSQFHLSDFFANRFGVYLAQQN